MKACKIKISTPLLFELIGLTGDGDLFAYKAEADGGGNIDVYITGSRSDIPNIIEGQAIPEAIIVCERIASHIEAIPPM